MEKSTYSFGIDPRSENIQRLIIKYMNYHRPVLRSKSK